MRPFIHRLRVVQHSPQLFHSRTLPSGAKKREEREEENGDVSALAGIRKGRYAYLAELGEVDLECFCIVFKAERDHRVEDVLAADRLAFLELAFLCRFGRYEADELRHTLLNTFLGVLRDFGGGWDRIFHDA
jgi:hypothetical protein